MVKEVLRRSETSREPNIQDILCSTAAIVFLGTPHRGSPGLADLGEIVRRTASTLLLVDSNATVLRTLGCDSPELELCRESFNAQWREHQFRVKTFQEALGLGGIAIGRYPDKVVPDTSSLLDDTREHAETINANHMDMVRFSSEADPGYQKVAGEIRIIVEQIYRSHQEPLQDPSLLVDPLSRPSKDLAQPLHQTYSNGSHQLLRPPQIWRQNVMVPCSNPVFQPSIVSSRPSSRSRTPVPLQADPIPALTDLEIECLKYLSFAQLGARQDNIKPELEGTCQWISLHPIYLEWEARSEIAVHRGMLWIKGKAGAGKSVIMKKILGSVRERELPGSIVASFFFNARGADLERNTMGMYRSLLHQILQQDYGLRQAFLSHYLRKKQTERLWDLREEELQYLLSSFLRDRTGRPIYLFIDALDECKEDEVRAVVNYLRDLTDHAYTAGNRMSVCMSSRRYPTISVARCPEIDVEDGNRSDVTKYVREKIVSHADGAIPETLAIAVDKKASHVFLWAVLVVEMLLRGWDNGTSLHELEAMLHQIPREIEQVFDGLTNTLTSEERPEAIRMFQWVLLSQTPLSLGSLEYAIFLGVEEPPSSFTALHEREGRFDSLRFIRRITHFSRGMIEVIKRPNCENGFIVQVIHESVRDWFFDNNGFARLDATLEPFPIGKGHLQIVGTCLNILRTQDFLEMHPLQANVPSGTSRETWSSRKGTYWLSNHSRQGMGLSPRQGMGLSLEDDVLGITRYCANHILTHSKLAEDRGAIPVRLLASLSKHNSTEWANLREAITEDNILCYHPASHSLLTLLCRKGFVHSVAWLLQNDEVPQARAVTYNAISATLNGKHLSTLKILDAHTPLHSITNGDGRNPFHLACEIMAHNWDPLSPDILRFIAERGCDVDSSDRTGMTGAMIVVDNGGSGLLEVLLELGAHLDMKDDRGRTALHRAVEKDNPKALTMLINSGCSLVARDIDGQIPLHKAAAMGKRDFVKELMVHSSKKVALNMKDVTGSTPLHLAALSGAGEVVCTLVLAGADANCPDEAGQTPLHIAARKISYATLEIMLDNGADRLVKDRFGMTAADHAESVARHVSIIELLELGSSSFGRTSFPVVCSRTTLTEEDSSETLSDTRYRSTDDSRLEM
jgi:ankyrin repeat protein